MPKIYDQDLRDKAISNWQKTGNKSKTARLFEINRNTAFENYVKSQKFDTAKQLREQYLKDYADISISYNALALDYQELKNSLNQIP
ncbi:hypothetical protein ACGTJS_08300 [Faucicola mancuniensis]|uniref:hypothetical protein n=1 Tax=Faucicola mancuniensis TaxID=1309795 RepID=UPI003977931D